MTAPEDPDRDADGLKELLRVAWSIHNADWRVVENGKRRRDFIELLGLANLTTAASFNSFRSLITFTSC